MEGVENGFFVRIGTIKPDETGKSVAHTIYWTAAKGPMIQPHSCFAM
jgi:hypothetical protein